MITFKQFCENQYWVYVDPKKKDRMRWKDETPKKKKPPRRPQDYAKIKMLKLKEEKTPEEKMTGSSVKRNMTKKGGGGFGMPTVHQVIEREYSRGNIKQKEKAHDLATGKYLDAPNYHNNLGRNWSGSDMGKNVTKNHDQKALKKKGYFKVTSAANVLNVIHGNTPEESMKHLHSFVRQAARITHPNGVFYTNHPKDPRYHGLGNKEIESVLNTHFNEVKKDSEKKDVYICKEPKH